MKRVLWIAVAVAVAALAVAASASAQSFTNTVLRAPFPGALPPGISTNPPNQSGDSEPAIDFGGPDATMAVDGLGWLPFAVNLWKGHFGDMPPSYFGPMDTRLPINGNGRLNLGDGDADVEVTSAGTILLADLDIIFNGARNNVQLGVSVTRCPATASGPSGCHSVVLDTAGADRPWITTRGTEAWISYHNNVSSTMITVWHSTNDGRTWTRVSSPIVGQGGTTAGSTFNNSLGPIVADPTSNYIYQPFMAGEPQTKGFTSNFNNVYVARSADGGLTWTVAKVFHAPPFTRLNNFWPTLAVDETTGQLWVAWTDLHGVSVATSAAHGAAGSWSPPVTVSTAATTVMPWVAARGGKVDVVYYGSLAATPDDQSAVWNTYDSQFRGGGWNILTVSNTPNRVGPVCLEGSACEGNRELLDLFEVAEDPITNRAAVIYTDTKLDTWTSTTTGTHQLPEIVLAYEQP